MSETTTRMIKVYVGNGEYALIKEYACQAGLTLTAYGRQQLLVHHEKDQSRLVLANEIREMGIMLRAQIWEHGRGSPEHLSILWNIDRILKDHAR